MTRIIFAPTCGKCQKVIRDVISVEEVDVTRDPGSLVKVSNFFIHPSVCPHCGEAFEAVMMPTQLPVDFSEQLSFGVYS